MTTLGIRIPEDEKEQFLRIAKRRDTSASQILRAYIRYYIREYTEYEPLKLFRRAD